MRIRENDLRVLKTRKNIKKAFLELLKEKPLEKITVTQLAQRAEINKGTFYLHYSDIYELYEDFLSEYISEQIKQLDFFEDFFSNPQSFTKKYIHFLLYDTEVKKIHALEPNQWNRHLPLLVSDMMKQHIYSLNVIAASIENDLKLDAIIMSLTGLTLRYGKNYSDTIVEIISNNISSNFHINL